MKATFFGDIMKKILFLISCVVVVILIYIIKSNNKVIYLEISDKNVIGNKSVKYLSNKKMLEDYIYYKNDNNYRLIDFYNDIKNNKEIIFNNKEYTINNLFIKSNYIVLNIGHNEIDNIYKTELDPIKTLDDFVDIYENIIMTIRGITKENIIIIFDYNLEEKYRDYLYNKMYLISNKYDCSMILKNELLKYIKDFTNNKK